MPFTGEAIVGGGGSAFVFSGCLEGVVGTVFGIMGKSFETRMDLS